MLSIVFSDVLMLLPDRCIVYRMADIFGVPHDDEETLSTAMVSVIDLVRVIFASSRRVRCAQRVFCIINR